MEDVLGQGGGGKPTSGQMQNLLGEFKGVYESRLQRLDDAERLGEDTHKVCKRLHMNYNHQARTVVWSLFYISKSQP